MRAIAAGNCEVPKGPEAAASVWLADPFSLAVAKNPQSVQLHQYGNGCESDMPFWDFR